MCPGVGLLDHMVVLFFNFWGTSILFSAPAAPTYIPNNSVGGFPFLHTFSSMLIAAYLLVYFFVALGLCCLWALSSCGEQGLLFAVVQGLPDAAASRFGAWALGAQALVVRHPGSAVVEYRHSGNFRNQGLNPYPLH